MPTNEELLTMPEEEYRQSEKERKRKERYGEPIKTRKFYVRGSTPRQQKIAIKQYNKAVKRYHKLKEKARQEKIKRIIRIGRNVERVGSGVYKVAKAIPSIKYSESGRARLISAATRGQIPQNPLNARSPYFQKIDKRKRDLFRL